MSTSVAEALPLEIARVRDLVMPAYIEIGSAGAPALYMMRLDMDRAARAMVGGDVAAMIEVLQALKDWKL